MTASSSSTALGIGVGLAMPVDPTHASQDVECTDADLFKPNSQRHLTLEPQTLNQDDQVIREAPSAKTSINFLAFPVTPVVAVVASASAAPPAPAGGAARQDSPVAEKVDKGEDSSAASARAVGRESRGGGFEGGKGAPQKRGVQEPFGTAKC